MARAKRTTPAPETEDTMGTALALPDTPAMIELRQELTRRETP